jgi:hypothetical protein
VGSGGGDGGRLCTLGNTGLTGKSCLVFLFKNGSAGWCIGGGGEWDVMYLLHDSSHLPIYVLEITHCST